MGNSEVVQVSTIHERLWAIIKRAQPQLLICHKEKIKEVIAENDKALFTSDKAQFFRNLDELEQQEFIEFSKKTKDIFYQSRKLKAQPFSDAYKSADVDKPEFLNRCLKSVEKFKYVVGLLYKNQRLKECLGKINSGEETRVYYDSKVNSDRLHYMKFSHDTLLRYGLELVQTYPVLCRLIVDSYPYFFIDEYQDTHCDVVKFIKVIHDYAIENNRNWMVGYFGDVAQNIYDDGVGRKIVELHDRLSVVKKVFNRRSHQQIIDVANRIRADEIVQIPIFEGMKNGSARFFYNNSGENFAVAQDFLAEYKKELAERKAGLEGVNDVDSKIDCLVLTNKLMADFNGFGDVYEVYKKSSIYYDNLNTQVLSQQIEKLHPVVLMIYRFVKLYQDIQKGEASYYDIFGVYSKDITFSKASLVLRELKSKEIVSFEDWIDLITDRLKNGIAKEVLCKAIGNRVNFEQDKLASSEIFRSTLLEEIHYLMNEDVDAEDRAEEKVDSLLELPILSLIKWANFIEGSEVGDIVYHTCHGTKGEEYTNVAVILEHSFGRMNRDKFKNYFDTIQKNAEERERTLADMEVKEKHINTQNLLYVACSRAIENLRVLYLDDISEIVDGIESIFGESIAWPID